MKLISIILFSITGWKTKGGLPPEIRQTVLDHNPVLPYAFIHEASSTFKVPAGMKALQAATFERRNSFGKVSWRVQTGNEPDTLLLPGAHFIVWQELPGSYPQRNLMQEFTDAYQRKFNKLPDIYAVVAYDAIRVTVEAMKRAKAQGPKDSERIRAEIEKIKNFPAVYGGTYSFSKDDHRGLKKQDALMIQVKDGKFRMAK